MCLFIKLLHAEVCTRNILVVTRKCFPIALPSRNSRVYFFFLFFYSKKKTDKEERSKAAANSKHLSKERSFVQSTFKNPLKLDKFYFVHFFFSKKNIFIKADKFYFNWNEKS